MTREKPSTPVASGDFVKDQYEAYPYPARDPADEAKRLIEGSPSRLDELDHYLFEGRRDWSQPFRALFAGGGTGDGCIMLAQQCADRGVPAEIVYLDLSRASRQIAEARAAARGLTSIAFHTSSLLEAPSFGPFDYIDCCGVLHHLPEPAAGFAALASALAPGGGMGLMVYGELGRTGVYDMQALLRTLTPPETDEPPERLKLAKALLASLPPTNRFRANPLVGDHLQSDAGLYDLLLHTQDRAYRVPELLAELTAAGLRLVSFLPSLLYDPAFFIKDRQVLGRLAVLSQAERAAMGEVLVGNRKTHVLYCVPSSRTGETMARPDRRTCVPVWFEPEGPALARSLAGGKPLKGALDGLTLTIPLSADAAMILSRVDGRRSLGEIEADLAEHLSGAQVRAAFRTVYQTLNGLNMMGLKTR